MQLIIYTDYDESKLEILNKTRTLLEEISERLVFDINEKLAVLYLFDMLSANMLDSEEHDRYMEMNTMLVNPRDRYFKNKGKLEVARNLLDEGFPIEKVVKITGLSERDILNAK